MDGYGKQIAQEVAKILAPLLQSKEWLTDEEAMYLLNMKESTFRKVIKKGRITISQVSDGIKLYKRKSIEQYIRDNEIKAIKRF